MNVHLDTTGTSATRRGGLAARAAALLVAGFFVLHGLAHLVGIKDIWGIGAEVSNTATYLSWLDAHSAAYAALGGVWLVAACLFVIAAAGIVLRRSWWLVTAFAAAVISLAVCILWRDAAIVGLVVNAVILLGLVAFAFARRAGRTH